MSIQILVRSKAGAICLGTASTMTFPTLERMDYGLISLFAIAG
ncbi:hypothetical protein [Nostoc sp. LEGE 12450]|nr:hypothetical protein [Nostoc sp. LEGE 12450]